MTSAKSAPGPYLRAHTSSTSSTFISFLARAAKITETGEKIVVSYRGLAWGKRSRAERIGAFLYTFFVVHYFLW